MSAYIIFKLDLFNKTQKSPTPDQRRTKRDSIESGELRRLQQEFEADFSKPKVNFSID